MTQLSLKRGDGHLTHGGGQSDGDLLTIPGAASLLQVSVATVRGYINEGLLPVVRTAGARRVRLRRADVMALLRPIAARDAKAA